MSGLSRRALAHIALRVAAFCATGAVARSADDRGLGGTGAVPTDPEETVGQDRGIGGTGVVGTIRRFGSIVVNDLRVTYPGDVLVTVDGARATAADLRIGQVVRVVAHNRTGGLATRAISVTNEVVGPVEASDDGGLTVLGQRVLADRRLRGRVRLGRVVAVGGLRRPDGAIVASLVVPQAAATPARLAGPVATGPDGTTRIGGLEIIGLKPSLVGRRVVLAGRRVGDAFHASAVTIEPAVPFAGVDRLSIEGYLARSGEEIRFGSGVTLAAGGAVADLNDGEVVRAVVVAARDGLGGFAATDVRVERGPRQGGRGPGRRAPGEIGARGAQGRQRGPGPGPAPAGPGAPSRGGPPGGAGPDGGRSPGSSRGGGAGGGNSQGGAPR